MVLWFTDRWAEIRLATTCTKPAVLVKNTWRVSNVVIHLSDRPPVGGWLWFSWICIILHTILSLMFCVFLRFFCSVFIGTSAISSSDSSEPLCCGSLLPKQLRFQADIYHRSTPFPSKHTFESIVYSSHHPNLVNASWLRKISRRIWGNRKQKNQFE